MLNGQRLPAVDRSGWLQPGLAFLVLALLAAVSYSNSLDGEFVFDDLTIHKGPLAQLEKPTLSEVVSASLQMSHRTRPIANLSFGLNYYLHGLEVRGYHLVNLAIHILTGFVLFLLFKTTLGLAVLRREYRAPAWVPLAAAAIWLVHPLQTQAVSYIVQRMTSLCALFYLVSLLCYVRARLAATPVRRWALYGGCVIAGLLAFGSKEISATLPFFILLYDWFFLRDLDCGRLKHHWQYWLALPAFLVWVVFHFLGPDPLAAIARSYDLVHQLDMRDFTPLERVLTEFRVMFFYLSLLLAPSPGRLSLEHDFALSHSLLDPVTTLFSIGGVAGLLLAAIFMAPRYRLFSFVIFWFFGNHLIEGSVLPLELVFEHRNYLPSTMVVLAGVVFLTGIVSRRSVQAGVICLVLLLFSWWTHQRNVAWQSRINLWRDCVVKAPRLPRPYNNLGLALKESGRLDEAVANYKKCLELDPGYIEAYANLGNVMMVTGRYEEAAAYYLGGLKVMPNHYDLALRYGHALFDGGHYYKARIVYRRVLRMKPGNVDAMVNLERLERLLPETEGAGR